MELTGIVQELMVQELEFMASGSKTYMLSTSLLQSQHDREALLFGMYILPTQDARYLLREGEKGRTGHSS